MYYENINVGSKKEMKGKELGGGEGLIVQNEFCRDFECLYYIYGTGYNPHPTLDQIEFLWEASTCEVVVMQYLTGKLKVTIV